MGKTLSLLLALVLGLVLCACGGKSTYSPNGPAPASTKSEATTPATTDQPSLGAPSEPTDAERLGVSEAELIEIEHVMNVAEWGYTRSDFERIYRLKDSEMILNPAVFVVYEVTISDGSTHRVTINRELIE